LVLALSYASSLRVYLDQRSDIYAAQAAIAQSQQDIDNLTTEINRWNDPAYVEAQARARLGWVMPGETGYRVIGPDGQPIDGGAEIAGATPTTQPASPWWRKLIDGLKKADQPAS